MFLIAWASRAAAAEARVFIFHKQNGYIHTATGDVVAALKADLVSHGIAVESSEDSLAFTAQNLGRFGAVVFLNTNYRNGPLLARSQEAAFEAYLKGGGAFVGIHSAVPLDGTAEEAIWPWYARLFGARFRSHAPLRGAPLVVEDSDHPSTRGLPARINVQDEWYAVQSNPRNEPGVRVLAKVDETGFLAESSMGGDHPVTWCRTFEGGRAWMTLVGHDMQAFSNRDFLAHVRGGILWAGGWEATAPVRGSILTYKGRKGTRLEVRLDGRHVQARRFKPSPAP